MLSEAVKTKSWRRADTSSVGRKHFTKTTEAASLVQNTSEILIQLRYGEPVIENEFQKSNSFLQSHSEAKLKSQEGPSSGQEGTGTRPAP
jgi:hypothetical protein